MKPVSWNGNAINNGTSYRSVIRSGGAGLAAVQAMLAKRTGHWPLVAAIDRPGRYQILDITIESGGSKEELARWFDYEDETAKQLIVENVDGSNDRYWMGVCEALIDVAGGSVNFEALIRIHGDIRLRETSATTDTVALTGTGQTKVLTNNGKDDAYPIFKIKPTSAKSGGFTKKRQLFIRWRSTSAYAGYPTDVTDHAFNGSVEIAGGDLQADGDDARIYVDGVEVNRWLDGIADTDSAIWCNIDFQGAVEGTLASAISGVGSVSSIQFSAMTIGTFAALPPAGVVVIGTEAYSYTSRNLQTMTLTGVTRAVKGTTAAAHSAGDTIWWVQHDIVLYYGDAALTAPTVDDNFKPAFTLASSTNTTWDYDEFGEEDGLRSGSWQFINVVSSNRHTANQNTDADPWQELGISNNILSYSTTWGRWELTNPCEITNANFQNGQKRSESDLTAWFASIQTRTIGGLFRQEDTIAAPSVTGAWQAWSDNEALTSASVTVILQLQRSAGVSGFEDQLIEVADVTLTLNSSKTPSVIVGAEQSVYPLDLRITNTTTGQIVDLEFGMVLNQQLELDTDARVVTYLQDNTNQFQALTLVGGPRKDWLKLQPGANTLQFDETGLAGMTVDFEWEERWYS